MMSAVKYLKHVVKFSEHLDGRQAIRDNESY